MAKNSTLLSNASFISPGEKNLPTGQAGLKEQATLGSELCPADAVITNIIAFSKALKIEKSREADLIEIVLN